jgi:hypothetical protein
MRAIHRAVVAAVLALGAGDARGDPPNTLVLRNLGTQSSRVQVAVGSVTPCDSSENSLVFDGILQGGEVRTVPVYAVTLCAHHTSGGTTVDWGPSYWITGGLRCPRRRYCVPDPTVPIRYNFQP